jgi:hypothetical protein
MPTGQSSGQRKGAWRADGRGVGTEVRFRLRSGAWDGVQAVFGIDGGQANFDQILGIGEVCRHEAVDGHRLERF